MNEQKFTNTTVRSVHWRRNIEKSSKKRKKRGLSRKKRTRIVKPERDSKLSSIKRKPSSMS